MRSVLVSRFEGDWRFIKASKPEALISTHFFTELIVLKEVGELAGIDTGDNIVTSLINAILKRQFMSHSETSTHGDDHPMSQLTFRSPPRMTTS